jgi:EpsI family protein
MPQPNARSGFLTSPAARLLTLVLVAQALLLYGFSRSELRPVKEPLASLPGDIGAWHMSQETTLDKDTLEILKADETLSRSYVEPGQPLPAQLFVAYFNSQRTGQSPHSPRNCLPGTGWLPTGAQTIGIPVAGRPPVEANRYLISKGEYKSIVLYWYQSRDRTVASEYKAKVYAVLDAIRYNRSDTALIRIIVPVVNNDEQTSTEAAVRFVQAIYPALRQKLPA